MSYFIKTTEPEVAAGQLQASYEMLETMFQMVPKMFIAQSIRPDLLEPLVIFVNRLLIEDHGLPRSTKELVAAYASKLNGCEY
jgi:alkylhydroperoxidase family enzyme